MVGAVLGCLFGTLGILTIGLPFVPLAGFCAIAGFVDGIVSLRISTVCVSLCAAALTVAGFIVSPSMWVLTGIVLAGTH